jgi:ubiquinone/menaquinone biosynthesis C-methylase UbiE
MVRATFDKVYFFYDFFEKYLLGDYNLVSKLIQDHLNLNVNYKIIDIGGGTGYIAKSIIDKVKDVTVVDLSRHMLKKLKKSSISAIQGNGSSLPIKNKEFDCILLINTLHHINSNDHQNVLLEGFRILKNQGQIYIIDSVFSKTNTANRILIKLEEILVGKTYHTPHLEIMLKLKSANFQDISVFFPYKNRPNFLIYAIKK